MLKVYADILLILLPVIFTAGLLWLWMDLEGI